MAFGTGTHPTTQLCLGLLEQHYQPGQSVIDVGCGSGILSIAANKLGAPNVLAVDVDSQSVISTKENAALNRVPQEALEIGLGSIVEIISGKFEVQSAPIVLVNILASIILRLFDQGLAKVVTDGGVLLLSGILEHQEDEIRQKANENGFVVIDKLSQKDWISLALRKS
jgi:ribosomal protein L11 methyltransferase